MNAKHTELPVFDGNTLQEIELIRSSHGAFGWNNIPCLASTHDGATRAMLAVVEKYVAPFGLDGDIDPEEEIAPGLRYIFLQHKAKHFSARGVEEQEHWESKMRHVTAKKKIALSLAHWLLALHEEGLLAEKSNFNNKLPAPMDPLLDSLYQDGDERDVFTLLYRFLTNLLDYDLVISEVKVFD